MRLITRLCAHAYWSSLTQINATGRYARHSPNDTAASCWSTDARLPERSKPAAAGSDKDGEDTMHSRSSRARQVREFATISTMLRLYCKAHHAPQGNALCPGCGALHDYAQRRLERCVFGEAKPTCANCTVHCYKPAMRAQIRQVMIWAGPRMLWRHPALAVWHLFRGRHPAPVLGPRRETDPEQVASRRGRASVHQPEATLPPPKQGPRLR